MITICNKTVNNNAEKYPFLLFRGVTYLPMTWAYLHDLLGCDYAFDGEAGLRVDRADETASALYLPSYREDGGVAAWRGWFWYQDSDGWISRVPMRGGARERLFELPLNVGYSDAPPFASLTASDGGLYLTYHLGGATMGHDEQYRFNADGSCVALVKANGPVSDFDGVRFHADCGVPPAPDNLRVSRDGGAAWERFGSPDYLYGWSYQTRENGGMSADWRGAGTAIRAAEGGAYLLATHLPNRSGETPDANGAYPAHRSAVCRVDLTSGETAEVAAGAAAFTLAGNTVWYLTFAGELRHCALDGAGDTAAALPDGARVTAFCADDMFVYVCLTDGAASALAVFPAAGGDAAYHALSGAARSMQPEDGWLTLLTQSGAAGETELLVLRNGEVVHTRRCFDVLAAGVSDGTLYYALK